MTYLINTKSMTAKFIISMFMLFAFCITFCGCEESYTTTSLNVEVEVNIKNSQDIKEIYDAITEVYSKELSEHTLTKISATYSSDVDGEPIFKSFTFEFCKDEVNWKKEQIINAITIRYNAEDEIINAAKKFTGTTKAYSGTGITLSENVLENFSERVKQEEIELKQVTHKKIKFWSNIYGEQVCSVVNVVGDDK